MRKTLCVSAIVLMSSGRLYATNDKDCIEKDWIIVGQEGESSELITATSTLNTHNDIKEAIPQTVMNIHNTNNSTMPSLAPTLPNNDNKEAAPQTIISINNTNNSTMPSLTPALMTTISTTSASIAIITSSTYDYHDYQSQIIITPDHTINIGNELLATMPGLEDIKGGEYPGKKICDLLEWSWSIIRNAKSVLLGEDKEEQGDSIFCCTPDNKTKNE